MIWLTIFVLVTVVASLLSTIFFLQWGAIAGAALTAAVLAWSYDALRGFGSPTASVPRSLPFIDHALHFLVAFVVSLLIYQGAYFARAHFAGIQYSKPVFWAWLVCLAIAVIGYGGFHAYRAYVVHTQKRYIRVEVGFDEELPIRWNTFSGKFIDKDGEAANISINGSSVGNMNQFGYSRSVSGTRPIFFEPEKMRYTILGSDEFEIDLPPGVKAINFYFSKERVLKVFINGVLVGTRPIAE